MSEPPSSRARALVALCLLALGGAADGVWLTLVHVGYLTGDVELTAACHAMAEAGCAVTAGRFGALAGVPVSVIGFAGSLSMAVLAAAAFRRRRLWHDPLRSVLLVMATSAVLASLVMALFSFLEGSFCPFCLIWYGINAGLAWAAWTARNRDGQWGDLLDDVFGGGGFAAVGVFAVGLMGGIFGHHTYLQARIEARDAEVAAHAQEIARGIVSEIVTQPPIRVPIRETAPSKGPADAAIQIVEFADFECPHCRRLWESLEGYLESTDAKVRITFVHFPLDPVCNDGIAPVHPHACAAAQAAECANRQGAFWAYGSRLFANQRSLERDDLVGYARELGLDVSAFESCLDDPTMTDKVRADAAMGMEIGITATPTFFVNGYMVKGGLHPAVLGPVLEGIAAHAQASGDTPQSGQ